MIILEGPDGSGKTTLLNVLTDQLKLPHHPRFCTSDGPFDNLAQLMYEDLKTMPRQELSIYDRHPFISEYVYASAIPERMVRDDFLEGWAINALRQFARNVLVIMCLPPYSEVKINVAGCQTCRHSEELHLNHTLNCQKMTSTDTDVLQCPCEKFMPSRHMSGVVENLPEIYQLYRQMRVFWPEQNNLVTYDYTEPNSLLRVLSRSRIHASSWARSRAE